MVTPELVSYIKTELAKNTPIDAIHAVLKRHNWKDDAINEGLRLALQDQSLLKKTLHLNGSDETYEIPKAHELLKLAWKEYKERFKTYSAIVGLPLVLSFIYQLIFSYIVGEAKLFNDQIIQNPALVIVILMWVAIGVIIFFVVQLWSAASLMVAIRDRYSGIQFKTAYGKARVYILPLYIVGMLTSLATLVGFFLFIIPGILFAIWFCLSAFVVVAEGLKGKKALSKSKGYVKGRWWKVYWKLSFIGFVSILVSMVVSMPFSFIPLPLVKELVTMATNMVITPIMTIYLYFLYEKLKASS